MSETKTYRFIPGKAFSPTDEETDILGWAVILEEDGSPLGTIDGMVVHGDKPTVEFATLSLNVPEDISAGKTHLLIPLEEIERKPQKQQAILEGVNAALLPLYPRMNPQETITGEMVRHLRRFYTSGYDHSVRLGNVIRKGPRTTMRHGPLSGGRDM